MKIKRNTHTNPHNRDTMNLSGYPGVQMSKCPNSFVITYSCILCSMSTIIGDPFISTNRIVRIETRRITITSESELLLTRLMSYFFRIFQLFRPFRWRHHYSNLIHRLVASSTRWFVRSMLGLFWRRRCILCRLRRRRYMLKLFVYGNCLSVLCVCSVSISCK